MTQLKIDLIAENLLSIHPLLFKSITKPLRNQTSITPGGMYVLGTLKRHGTLSMTEIGKYLSMPKPHVTVIIDKLIEEGYVERQSDPKDRRVVNILLTEKGSADFESIKLAISENLKVKLSSLNEGDQELLATATQQVKEILISILSKD